MAANPVGGLSPMKEKNNLAGSLKDLISDDETLRTNSYRIATAATPSEPNGRTMAQDPEDPVVKTSSNENKGGPSLGVRFLQDLWAYKNAVVTIGVPLVALPLLFPPLGTPQWTCAYAVIIMSAYWMFEVMPLAATALIPTFLFPMLGVLPSKVVCTAYLPDTNFLFIGGLIVAVAVERCNLHQRIALRVLTIVGSQPKWIMLGFMSVTAFLSMWISNTATTAMMVPIAQSVIQELLRHSAKKRRKKELAGQELQSLMDEDGMAKEAEKGQREVEAETQEEEEEPVDLLDPSLLTSEEQNIAKGMLICIAFAANIGGTGTITGTPPNLVTVGILEKTYAGADTGINYASWIQFAVPLMLVSVVVCWFTLVIYFLGPRTLLCRRKAAKSEDGVERLMKERYRNLPPMSFAEWSVLCCFLVLLLMWIFRDPKQIPGFGMLFKVDEKSKKSYYSDATSAMLIAVLLFVLPDQLPDFLCFKSRDRRRPPKPRGALMDWRSMQEKFPWSVVLLLGGGFALAAGVKSSGLSAEVGKMLEGLGSMDVVGVQFICVLITMAITNICSNTVTASIFVPIVAGLASTLQVALDKRETALQVHPLQLVLPVALACSFAFCLPVATPPNAIVFASGILSVADMMKSGLLISAVSALFIVLNQQTYTRLIFPLGEFPEWANASLVSTD